jgi:hypothetical protein
MVVCLLSGKVFRGLGTDDGLRVILSDVDRLDDGGDTAVRGTLRLPWSAVEFVQMLPVAAMIPVASTG